MSLIKFKKRPTKRLEEIIDSDLLPAHEKLVQNEIGGFYRLADESAYFRLSGDRPSLTVSQFEQKLRREIDPNFFVVYNPNITPKHLVQGHQVGYFVREAEGFIPLFKVGRSAEKIIPANTLGGKELFRGRKSGMMKEQPVISRGWVAGFEGCVELMRNLQLDAAMGKKIHPMRIVKAEDFFAYKQMLKLSGGKDAMHEIFMQARKIIDSENERLSEIAKEREVLEKEQAKKAVDFIETFESEKNQEVVNAVI